MIEEHICPHCKRMNRVWLPVTKDLIKATSACAYCEKEIDYTFVYEARSSTSFEEQEISQLRYLQKKYGADYR